MVWGHEQRAMSVYCNLKIPRFDYRAFELEPSPNYESRVRPNGSEPHHTHVARAKFDFEGPFHRTSLTLLFSILMSVSDFGCD